MFSRFLAFVAIALISACSALSPNPSPSPATILTNTITPTNTVIPTITPTFTPTLAPTPTPISGYPLAISISEYVSSDKCITWVYIDSGKNQPKIRVLANGGMFPRWSPNYERVAFLAMQGYSNFFCSYSKSGIQSALLMVANSEGEEIVQLAKLKIPYLTPSENFRAANKFFYWSPDGSKIAYLNYISHERSDDANTSDNRVRFEINIVSVDTGNIVTVGEATYSWGNAAFQVRALAWSPDSTLIAYADHASSNFGLYVAKFDGSDTKLVLPLRYVLLPLWIDNGLKIAFIHSTIIGRSGSRMYYGGGKLMQIDAGGKNLIELARYVGEPVLSPDGKYLAYAEDDKLHIMNLESHSINSIAEICGLHSSNNGGYRFTWSPDSLKIAFRTAEVLTDGCRFSSNMPVMIYSISGDLLFESTYINNSGVFDFSPDSNYFVFASGIIEINSGLTVYSFSDSFWTLDLDW